jgi:acyl carrier protein
VNALNAVKRIIAKQMSVPPNQLSAESSLAALGVESLDVIEIIFALEEKYEIAIPFNPNESAALGFETVGEVAAAVQKLVGAKEAS